MKIRSPFITKSFATLAMLVLRMLYGTCRVELRLHQEDLSPYGKSHSPERYLYCIWHDILLMAIFSGRPQHLAGLVSNHQDGSYLSFAMKLVGIRAIRGSSSRGGAKALKQCLETTTNSHLAITPDGPRGPRHHIKPGILFLASQTGRKIVPVGAACRRSWRIQGNWTDMLLPQPFTKVLVGAAEPVSVPENVTREEIEQITAQLEQKMQQLQQDLEYEVLHGHKPIATTAPSSLRKAA